MKQQKNKLKFNWPKIESKEISAVNKQLKKSISIYNRSGIIKELEQNLEKYFNVKHAVLMNSGTSALHSIYISLGLTDKDEVICPAYTFFATVTPLLFTGAVPVLVDCDKNGNIDPAKITEKINSRTKAIMITHMWGMPCQMSKIIKIAKKHKLLLLEDASHAHGSRYNGKLIGTFGKISAFSMQGQKTLTGGEGGFIITNNDNLYYKTLLVGHYNKRCKTEIPKNNKLHKYAITGMGLKFRIHPLAAAIANEQLKKLKQIISGRNKFAEYLINNLKGLKGIRVPDVPKKIVHSWYAFIIKFVPEELNNVTINDFLEYLIKNACVDADIPGSTCPLNLLPLFQNPALLFPKYKNKFSYKKGDFPNAEYFYNHIIKIPIWDKKNDLYIAKHYVKIIKKFLEKNKKINQNINYKNLLTQAKKDSIKKIVVGAILEKNKKILLLERPKDDFMGGIFELPSGNLEKGELLSEGLIREIKEETGLEVKSITKYINSFDYLSKSGKRVRQFNFLVELKNYKPIVLTEHNSFVWVGPKDINKFNITKKVKKVINEFQKLK